MISRQENSELAREFGLDPNVVEKDYVLGWLLAGIFNHPALHAAWVFKGGYRPQEVLLRDVSLFG